MKNKTQEEINIEVKKLEEMKPNVRHFTIFGDDNHEAIDAQLDALKNDIEEDTTYDWQDDEEFSEHACEAARQAVQWRDGEESEPPSESWAPLVKG